MRCRAMLCFGDVLFAFRFRVEFKLRFDIVCHGILNSATDQLSDRREINSSGRPNFKRFLLPTI
jgi:hypothetical protein